MERETAQKCQIKTKSCWGTAPSRYYKHIRYVEDILKTKIKACVIGAADGKFVLPLVRRGHQVTCFEIDNIAINGGLKPFPIKPSISNKMPYIPIDKPLKLESYPFKLRHIMGLNQRLIKEELQQFANIIQKDFYRSNTSSKYDFAFTSCSIQYKTNRDIPLTEIFTRLKESVKIGGFILIDYMLPLQDTHTWKSTHFLRPRTIKNFFPSSEWETVHNYEHRSPLFESAHVDRLEDHFHRLGYFFARRAL